MLPSIRIALPTFLAVFLLWAPAAHSFELAVQDDAVLYDRSYGKANVALNRAKALGAKYIRVNVRWAYHMPEGQRKRKTKPKNVRWDFGRLERLHADAAARGIKLQVTLTGHVPRWAAGNKRVGKARPNAKFFGQFASAVATQFAGRVPRYSTWNEPNWGGQLGPIKKAPALYRKLHQNAYRAIKKADPSAKVFIGELAPGVSQRHMTPALTFLRSLACVNTSYRPTKKCPKLLADGFAIHPYNFAKRPRSAVNRNPNVVEIGSLGRLTYALDRLRSRGRLTTPNNKKMPVYITEFGYHTSGPLRVSAKRHGTWLKEAYQIARRNKRVKQFLQYGLIEPWPKRVTWRTAILKKNGKPKPAYKALKKVATR